MDKKQLPALVRWRLYTVAMMKRFGAAGKTKG